MKIVALTHPPEFGAAFIQAFDADGNAASKQELLTPGRNLTFETRSEGAFLARVTPVGMPSRLMPFTVGSEERQTVRLEGGEPLKLEPVAFVDTARPVRHELRVDNLYSAEQRLPGLSIENATRLAPRHRAGLTYLFPDQRERPDRWVYPLDEVMRKQVTVVPAGRKRRIAVGLAQDERPKEYGGWRPFDGGEKLRASRQSESWVLLLTNDQDDAIGNGKRLRLEVAIEKQRIQRLLLPTFAGGTKVSLVFTSSEIQIHVEPVAKRAQLVLQMLTTGSPREAISLRAAVDDMSGSKREDADVFTSLAEHLAARRFGWPSRLSATQSHAGDYERMPDWLILKAAALLESGGPIESTLQFIHLAQEIGAPYFAMANAILGDLLNVLCATLEPSENLAMVSRELRTWREHLPYQTAVGPLFSWLRSTGYRTTGVVDERYSRVVLSTTVDMPDAIRPLSLARYKDSPAGLLSRK